MSVAHGRRIAGVGRGLDQCRDIGAVRVEFHVDRRSEEAGANHGRRSIHSVPWYGIKGVAMNEELTIGRIADLARMRRTLKGLIAECAAGQRPRSCPISVTLSANPGKADRRN